MEFTFLDRLIFANQVIKVLFQVKEEVLFISDYPLDILNELERFQSVLFEYLVHHHHIFLMKA